MSWRRDAAPKELLDQAGAAADLARAVARFFREPSEPGVIAARSRARAALDAGRGAQAAIRARIGAPGREDWLAVSRSLAELSLQAGRAVAQAKLYGVERRQRFSEMALSLRETAVELEFALRSKSPAEHLVTAKKLASSVDAGARRQRAGALSEARMVEGLKDQEVNRRLSEAAEAAHAAADRLAEVFAVK